MSEDHRAPVDRAIAGYIALRSKRDALKKEYEAYDKVVKQRMDAVEIWLLKQMESIGTTQLKPESKVGTAFIQTDTKFACGDWESFHKFCVVNNRLDFLHKRLSTNELKVYLEENEGLPPGVSMSTERKVMVRKG